MRKQSAATEAPPVRPAAAGAALALLLLSAAAGADDAAQAREWLDRMALALNNLSYQGSLVYLRGGHMESMELFHRVEDGRARERLVSTSGVHREVLRDQDTVRCIFPDTQSVVVDTRIAQPWFPVIPPEQAADPATRYDFRMAGKARVAGHGSQVIHIMPKDGYRYGYRLWLEDDTGMLLKSELLDESGEPLERVMFTRLEIGAEVRDADLEPTIPDDGFVQVEIPRGGAPARSADSRDWVVTRLPAGFTLSAHRNRTGETGENLEHLVFTDGLASVSVYVEAVPSTRTPLEGPGQVGAINMYGARLDGYSVTAIGEVPSATVKLMATSLQARE